MFGEYSGKKQRCSNELMELWLCKYGQDYDLIDCNDGHCYIVPNAGYYYDYLKDGILYNQEINSIGNEQMLGGLLLYGTA